LFRGLKLDIEAGARIAVMGRNGSGKTTLLRLMAGDIEPDQGKRWAHKDAAVASVQQIPNDQDKTVFDLTEEAYQPLIELESDMRTLEVDGLDQPDRYRRWEALKDLHASNGGLERRAERDAILHALGLAGWLDRPGATLSGGERVRLELALTLMRRPSVMLLDEPTNHLDLRMRGWLERHLRRYAGAVVLVSHDRAFLDAVANKTVWLLEPAAEIANGCPGEVAERVRTRMAIERRTQENLRKEEARVSNAAQQMRKWAGQNAKLMRRAKAMERRAERTRAQQSDVTEIDDDAPSFRFTVGSNPAIPLMVDSLDVTVEGQRLIADISFQIAQGDKVGIVGPNGAGKTSLLRRLIDPAAYGVDDQVVWHPDAKVAYLDQQLRGWPEDRTLLATVEPLVGPREAHNALATFRFPIERHATPIGQLSGGERTRLALLSLTLDRHDVLVLDEPTNHLDVEMIQELEVAVAAFTGSVLLVSHDRTFLEATCDRLLLLEGGQLHDLTRVEDGLDRLSQGEARETGAAKPVTQARSAPQPATEDDPHPTVSLWQAEKDLDALHQELEAATTAIDAIDAQLGNPQSLDAAALAAAGRKRVQLEASVETLLAHGESLERAIAAKRNAKQRSR
jgi:ATP-binding cassette subfamily F protein 3